MNIIETTDAFTSCVDTIRSKPGYKDPLAFGICRIDYGQLHVDKVLQATYPLINWNENFGSAAIFMEALQEQHVNIDYNAHEVICNIDLAFLENCLNAFTPYADEAMGDAHKNIQVVSALYNQLKQEGCRDGEFRVVFLFDDAPCESVEATYLKLYAISQAKVPLRSVNLDGAFGALPNVAWSAGTPIELEWLREFEIELKLANGTLTLTLSISFHVFYSILFLQTIPVFWRLPKYVLVHSFMPEPPLCPEPVTLILMPELPVSVW